MCNYEISGRKIAVRIILFVGIFVFLFIGLGSFFQPVWYSWSNYDTTHGFYDEPENTIETIFLGASIVANGISPMELYEEYGICAYNLGLEEEPLLASYYWMEEAYRLHSETMSTVVIDVSILRKDVGDSLYRKSLDAMQLSSVKLRAVMDYTDGSISETLSYLIPLYSYHERWSKLGETDFTKQAYQTKDYLRGYNFITSQDYWNAREYSKLFVPEYYPDFGSDEMEFKTESLYYLKQMIDFCDEHDIKLVLIKTPGQSMGTAGHNAVKNIADEYGLDFLDFNYAPLIDEIGYNQATDSADGVHMNYYGAAKLTAWLGNYLVEECGATDVRGMEGFEFMETELAEYHKNVTEGVMVLKNARDPAEYLSVAMENENYTVFIAVRDDAAKRLTETQKEIFSALGLSGLAEIENRDSYIAVVDGGTVLYEAVASDPARDEGDEEADDTEEVVNDLEQLTMEDVRAARAETEEALTISYEGKISDGVIYEVMSGGWNLGNVASVLLDETEYAENGRGLNIVVYDKVMHEVVDAAVFDTFASAVREGGDKEAALAADLENTDDYTTLSADLQKLYLYDVRCEDKRTSQYLKQTAGETGFLTYLNGILGNEDYAVFLSVRDEASSGFSDEVRDTLARMGLVTLSELEYRDSYFAVILGGELICEERDHGEEAIICQDVWFPEKNGTTEITYKVVSGGNESGNISSIIVNGTECSPNTRGVNIVVWNVVTDEKVAGISFDTCGAIVSMPENELKE